jgi:hypothetical protein
MKTTRVNGPADPSPTLRDIEVIQKFTSTTKTDNSGNATLTIQSLLSVIPGSNIIWDRIRIMKISAYAPAVANSFIALEFDESTFVNDRSNFIDYGTAGSRRPAIHVSPAFNKRIEWLDTNNEQTFLRLRSLPDTEIVATVTVHLRSKPPASLTF